MALIQLRCPNCNGSIQMDDTKEAGFCMYCGSKFMVQDEARRAMQYATVEISREKESANLENYSKNLRVQKICKSGKFFLNLDAFDDTILRVKNYAHEAPVLWPKG